MSLAAAVGADIQPPASVFGERWLVLEHAGGDRPDVLQIAPVARRLRDSLMSTWPAPIPEWLCGHTADGAPSLDPHLAVAPIVDAGQPYATGQLLGVGLVAPRGIEPRVAPALAAALARLSGPLNEIELRLGSRGVWLLRHTPVPRSAALKPSRYAGRRSDSENWMTVTPIALDRHARGSARGAAVRALISAACLRAGLPPPAEITVVSGSPLREVPGAQADWARPRALAGRPLTHAHLRFAQPVRGPVILGAGRFLGLGLCLPAEA